MALELSKSGNCLKDVEGVEEEINDYMESAEA